MRPIPPELPAVPCPAIVLELSFEPPPPPEAPASPAVAGFLLYSPCPPPPPPMAEIPPKRLDEPFPPVWPEFIMPPAPT